MEANIWSEKLLSDLAIYAFSILGFAFFPGGFGRGTWLVVGWFLFVNVAFLLGSPVGLDWEKPYMFIVLGQAPWVLLTADLLFRGKVSRMLADVSLRDLVLWQSVRLMGVHYVLAVYGRHVPQDFALQVGFSEILTALGALALYVLYRPDRAWYRTLLVFWNTYGLTSVLAADYRTFFSNPHFDFARYSREIFQYMTSYPQSWVYCFWFPLAIGMHAAVYYKLYIGRSSGR